MVPAERAPPDPVLTAVMDDLRRVVRLLRRSSAEAERLAGVSGAQAFVLRQLLAHGPASINALADLTHTHQSSVSVVVQRLVDAGLATRAPFPGDRRRVVVTLTPAGRRVLGRAPDLAQTRLIDGLSAMGAPDRDALAHGLRAWVRAMGAAEDPTDFFFEHDHGVEQPTEAGE